MAAQQGSGAGSGAEGSEQAGSSGSPARAPGSAAGAGGAGGAGTDGGRGPSTRHFPAWLASPRRWMRSRRRSGAALRGAGRGVHRYARRVSQDLGRETAAALGLVIVVVVVILYYAAGGQLAGGVDLQQEPPTSVAPASLASSTASRGAEPSPSSHPWLTTAAALLRHEMRDNAWVANDPWIYPSGFRHTLGQFQVGVAEGVRTTVTLARDQARAAPRRSTRQRTVASLNEALAALAYPAEAWFFSLGSGWVPRAPAEHPYRRALAVLDTIDGQSLLGTSARAGQAALLAGLSDRLVAMNDSLDNATRGGIRRPGRLFHRMRGEAYVYYHMLGVQAARAVEEGGPTLTARQAEALEASRMALWRAANLSPLRVLAGDPDGARQPNHLLTLGFYLAVADSRLKDVLQAS